MLPSEQASKINQERGHVRGHPGPQIQQLTKMWSAIAGVELSMKQTLHMLIAVKQSRDLNNRIPDPDDMVDICGWTNVHHLIFSDLEGSDARSLGV